MEVDFIIVGCGLAGISFCEQLRAHQKTFVVFDDHSQQSSTVAGGLYNPVVLKRFTPVWKSTEQLQVALKMYRDFESEFKIKLDYKIPVYRKFASAEEQNDWFTASDKPRLSQFLSTTLIKNTNPWVLAPFGFGEVLQTGRIDVKCLIETYKQKVLRDNLFFDDKFNYNKLKVTDEHVLYGDIAAKYIVFAEGYGTNKNPFFNTLPLLPTKGELLTIYAPDLQIDFVLKGPAFLIPLGEHKYIVGATYHWGETSHTLTERAKDELLEKLRTMISCDFKIVGQQAGIRPTVKDRRPLVGAHVNHKNMFIINGLGTRGVMVGPYVASQLFNFIFNGVPLEDEIDINRFA